MGPFRRPALTLASIEDIFQRRQWRYARMEEGLLTSFENVTMVFFVDEERQTAILQVPVVPGRGMAGYHPVRPSAENDACVYLMARNFYILLGRYCRDHVDGEIRFAVAIPVLGSVLVDEQLEHAILAGVGTVTRDAAVLNALLTGAMPLGQALARIDTGDSPPTAMVV
ncbi:MAG TPA: hypothetical protein VIC85_21430 [Ktedonobacterales bacterium]|jgi:hypothetical protein